MFAKKRTVWMSLLVAGLAVLLFTGCGGGGDDDGGSTADTAAATDTTETVVTDDTTTDDTGGGTTVTEKQPTVGTVSMSFEADGSVSRIRFDSVGYGGIETISVTFSPGAEKDSQSAPLQGNRTTAINGYHKYSVQSSIGSDYDELTFSAVLQDGAWQGSFNWTTQSTYGAGGLDPDGYHSGSDTFVILAP